MQQIIDLINIVSLSPNNKKNLAFILSTTLLIFHVSMVWYFISYCLILSKPVLLFFISVLKCLIPDCFFGFSFSQVYVKFNKMCILFSFISLMSYIPCVFQLLVLGNQTWKDNDLQGSLIWIFYEEWDWVPFYVFENCLLISFAHFYIG